MECNGEFLDFLDLFFGQMGISDLASVIVCVYSGNAAVNFLDFFVYGSVWSSGYFRSGICDYVC